MIRSALAPVERLDYRPRELGFLTWKDGPNGLLASVLPGITFPLLGDASRGALYLALRPAASNGEKPVATTPRATGFLPVGNRPVPLRDPSLQA
jgi:hypothetical protein